jgi:hypothetical protein
MKLGNTNTAAAVLHPLNSRKGTWTGAHIESGAAAAARSRVIPHDGLPSWTFSLDDNGVHYQTLTSEQARAMMAEMHASARPAADDDGKSWWSTIGDFFESILEGVVKIAVLVVDGVKATFKFVLEGVTYVFDAVVQFVQDSVDMLESILATVYDDVVDFFERTFEWIGFLFDWPDILRTRDALAHVIGEMFGFLEEAGPGLKKLIDPKFATAQQEVTNYFNQLITKFGGAQTLGSFAKDNDRHEPRMAYAQGNNVVSNALTGNWQNAKPTNSMRAAVRLTTVDTNDLDRLTRDWATGTVAKPAFGNAATFFEGPSSADQFFAEGMAALLEKLKDLILATLSGAQAVIDKALDLLKTMVAKLRALAEASIEIPLLSELYKWIAKAEQLTALDLVALIAAIPATILYKAINNAAPFPDKPSVDRFKAAFTAERLLQVSGLKPAAQAVTARDNDITKTLLLAESAALTVVFGLLSASLTLLLAWIVTPSRREHRGAPPRQRASKCSL